MNSKGLEGITVSETSISSIVDATLKYRGYDIDDLANHASFEEVIYLLWKEKLPNKDELATFKNDLFQHSFVPEKIFHILRDFPKDANTMDILRTLVSSLPIFDQEKSNDTYLYAIKLQAKIATLVAAIGRTRKGKVPLQPVEGYSYAKNFLYMLKGSVPTRLEEETFNKALILHADHEFNASTFSSRVTVATLSDMYSGVVSAIGTLKGPLHGGANEEVMRMLNEIGNVSNVDSYISDKFTKKEKIMGIGHRVYKNGDPRAKHLKKLSKELCSMKNCDYLYEISEKVEELVTKEKGLLPNVDFYSASVYFSLEIPSELFTPIFAVSRTSGWTAHILEQFSNNRLIRPRAEYIGKTNETYIPLDER